MRDNFFVLKYIKHSKTLYTKLIMKEAKKFGLTQNEADVLLFLNNNPQFNTATDIVTNRLIAKSNVSTAVESLRLKNYVSVKTDEVNRRVVRIFLTQDAQPVIDDLKEGQNKFACILKESMGDEEIEMFFALIEKNHVNVIKALNELEKEG